MSVSVGTFVYGVQNSEEYRRIIAEHPRPMFASYEEMKAAADPDEDPDDAFHEASWLWRANQVRADAR